MKLIVFTFIALYVSGDKWVKKQITEDISLKIPESFYPMTPQDMRQRVLSYRKPLALFTDPSRRVELGVNFAFSKWRPSDLGLLKEFQKSSLLNIFTEVEFIQEDIQEINGIQYIVFEFISTSTVESDSRNLKPIKKYTLLLFTLDKNRTILFNFTSPADEQLLWQDTAKKIMESIKIKN